MQIKIRAWDSINKEMLSWEDLLAGREFRPKMRSPEAYGLQLMPYTATDDGNGNEIYEDDIVYSTVIDRYGRVVYFEGAFYVHFKASSFEPLSEVINDLKVKGNVYENAELMEEEQ